MHSNSGVVSEVAICVEDAIKLYKKDPSSFYPSEFYKSLCNSHDWQMAVGTMIAKMYNIESVVDFGCGIGAFLEGFKQHGSRIQGYEYLYDNAKKYIPEVISECIQYGNVMENIDCGKFELSMSIEVAEHILEEKSDIFVDNLCNASSKYIIFTAAPCGQKGSGHINCHPIEFWIGKFKNRGFNIDDMGTMAIRDGFNGLLFKNRYMNLIRKTILMFKKDN